MMHLHRNNMEAALWGLFSVIWKLPRAVRTTQIWPFPFRMSPMEDIEGDLKEVQKKYCSFCGRKATRTFLTGAPFRTEIRQVSGDCRTDTQVFPGDGNNWKLCESDGYYSENRWGACRFAWGRTGRVSCYSFCYLTGIFGTGRFQCLPASRCFTGR